MTSATSAAEMKPVTPKTLEVKRTTRATSARRKTREKKMKTWFKIVHYDDKLSFQTGINSEYEDNYILQSWQIDDTWGIVAIYYSVEAAVETTLKVITESQKQAEKL
jgi:hypothetical protein